MTTTPFSDEQWDRLQEVYPFGVCDYTQRGVGMVPIQGVFQRFD